MDYHFQLQGWSSKRCLSFDNKRKEIKEERDSKEEQKEDEKINETNKSGDK